MFDYDLFVIGAGSGGVRAARIASENGAKVAIAEEYRVGGTCVIRGCIPKKLLVYASQFAEEFEDAVGFGWTVKGAFDWATLIKNKDAEIDRLNGLYFKTLAANNVKLFEARATLKDKNTVQVGDHEITAKTILVATGAAPYIPDIPGAEHAISSNEVFHLKELPKRLLIIGAGYISVEFAGIFNGLGVETTVAYRKNLVLRGFDEDLRARLTAAMQARGIRFFFNIILEKIEKTKDGLKVTDSNGDQGIYDVILCAVGRLPNTAGMGLEEIGVKLAENGAVEVDEYSRSSVDNIFAVGDVTDRIALTPVAIREGHAFALTEYGGVPTSPEHDNVASAVFSQPPIGTVGLTETEAKEKFGKIDVYTSDFRPLKLTLGQRQDKTFIKMIVDQKTNIVVGVHMLGTDATEIIQGVAIAVKSGLTKDAFDITMAIHPTTAEEMVLLKQKQDN